MYHAPFFLYLEKVRNFPEKGKMMHIFLALIAVDIDMTGETLT